MSIPNLNLGTSEGKRICTGLKRQYTQVHYPTPLQNKTFQAELIPSAKGRIYSAQSGKNGRPAPLTLNHWTILSQLGLNPRTASNGKPSLKGRACGLYLAVLPSDQPMPSGGQSWEQDSKGRVNRLRYGKQSLPNPPDIDWENESQAFPPN